MTARADPPDEANVFVETTSSLTFAPTVARLEQAIERAGLTVFARIDHAEAARGVGLAMPATLVLIYGNPKGGTPIMLETPRAALDLPLRILVREDGHGVTHIGFHPIAGVLRAAGVPDALAGRLTPAQAILIEETRP